MIDRRSLLAAAPLLAVPGSARARVATLPVVAIHAPGGWDATRVLADAFDLRVVARERGAERARHGGLDTVAHPDRPAVSNFFAANAHRCLIFDGVALPTITHAGALDWDTHDDNDARQSRLWERLFAGLDPARLTLVQSDLGRAPAHNARGGKEHWPFTSFLAFGPALDGGHRLGGYDRFFYGRPVHPESLEADDDGVPLTPALVRRYLGKLL
ncbi:MAG: DUF1501 domain-containing protein [Deltaproteobacteria bacterium]|nr:DUF1501 domain-containing protein [Deltaproteobacteria bacterium]